MMAMHESKLFGSRRYLFLFAHPDDDLYCCVLMRRLIEEKKSVDALYLTSGDAGGGRSKREEEVFLSMKQIGMEKKNVRFLGIPEKKLPHSLHKAVTSAVKMVESRGTDCAVGHDYEGGHEVHDIASFCLSEAVRLGGVEEQFVFPVYHGPPGKRKGARFKPARENPIVLPFTMKERILKETVLNCYDSQKEHFRGLGDSTPDYFDLLFSREIFYNLSTPIDYGSRPMEEVGYELHRNRFTFEKFQLALARYREQMQDRNSG
jgi:LmbE family N-acetylglucosaminyl deacetylase